MNIITELQKLYRSHFICEDCFYSCPKSGEWCNGNGTEGVCNCGADEHNAIVDGIIAYINSTP